MKKTLVILFFITINISLFAELKSGDILLSVGTSFGLNTYETIYANNSTYKFKRFDIDLIGQFMLSSKLAVGGSYGYLKKTGDLEYKGYYIGGNISYYFNPEGNIHPYVSLKLGFVDWDYAGTGNVMGSSLGILWFMNKSIALRLSVYYKNFTLENGSVTSEYRSGSNIGFLLKL